MMTIAQVRHTALSLPDTTEEPHFHFCSFRVRGKIFLTVPPGEEHLHVFVDETQREPALMLYAEFIEKLMWGKKVAGIRVNLTDADPAVVERLIRQAWCRKAPKKLRDVGGCNDTA